MLVVTPTDYIARGFSLDTTWHKGQMLLWKVVMPLHRPFANIVLNYSERLAGDNHGHFFIDPDDYPKSASVVMKEICLHLPSLEKICAPHDFLGHIAWRSGATDAGVNIDFALSHYLTGNVAKAAELLRNTVRMVEAQEPKWRSPHAELATFLRDMLETDSAGLLAIINGWRDQNIETLDLSLSRANLQRLRIVR
jgi:hypothetical protein